MSTLVQRSLTALVFVTILLTSIFWSKISLQIIFFIFTIIGTHEFLVLSVKKPSFAQKLNAYLASGTFYLSISSYFLYQTNLNFVSITVLFFVISTILEMYKKRGNIHESITLTSACLIYIALPFSLISYLANFDSLNLVSQYNPEIFLGYLFLIWSNDTGAYLVGRKIGKRKLFPSVSPNKTWEGTLGGIFFTLIISYFISIYFEKINLIDWLSIAIIVGIFGTLGDLVESKLKREANVKDSGKIMPGHGGILDRFDSLLISMPIVYLYLSMIELFK